MSYPPYFYPNSGSFDDLSNRLTQRLREYQIDSRIVEILQRAFEQELSQGNLVLSRSDRTRLFQHVSKAILADALGKIDGPK